MEIKPSIRSKFDQKLLSGATPNKSANPIAIKNPRTEYEITDFLGRYSVSTNASDNQATKIISTIILQANTLVVMNGKKKLLETRNGTNGTRKSPENTAVLNICLFIVFILSEKSSALDLWPRRSSKPRNETSVTGTLVLRGTPPCILCGAWQEWRYLRLYPPRPAGFLTNDLLETSRTAGKRAGICESPPSGIAAW